MIAFRIYLALIFLVITAYTGLVVADHGTGLFGVFFGDMAKLGWPGQFNLDFMAMLSLSGLWIAWRNNFSPLGLGLGVLGFLGGAPFLSAYLIFASIQANGDMKEVLLGKERAHS